MMANCDFQDFLFTQNLVEMKLSFISLPLAPQQTPEGRLMTDNFCFCQVVDDEMEASSPWTLNAPGVFVQGLRICDAGGQAIGRNFTSQLGVFWFFVWPF